MTDDLDTFGLDTATLVQLCEFQIGNAVNALREIGVLLGRVAGREDGPLRGPGEVTASEGDELHVALLDGLWWRIVNADGHYADERRFASRVGAARALEELTTKGGSDVARSTLGVSGESGLLDMPCGAHGTAGPKFEICPRCGAGPLDRLCIRCAGNGYVAVPYERHPPSVVEGEGAPGRAREGAEGNS